MTGCAKQSIAPVRHAKRDCFVACASRNDESNVSSNSIETSFMTRIAVGGFLHETNTFAPTKATYDDFVHGGGWPAMAQGQDVLKVMRNINVGLAGFVEAAEANGWEMVPTISWAPVLRRMSPRIRSSASLR